MSIIDQTLPDDDVLVSDLPSYIRGTRTALNTAGLITYLTSEVSLTSQIVPTSGSISMIYLLAPYAIDVSSIAAGTDGDIVILTMGTSLVQFIHNTGNLVLKGDPNDPDFPTQQGDILGLIYRNSVWTELFRALV